MNSPKISNSTSVTIKETLDLIKQADQIIKNSTHKDAILVLGTTGVGKTPFTKWMTQDNTKLMSVQNEADDPYLMEDTDNTIGIKTIESATKFPALYINATTNTAFYDFPGFHDTRGMAYGIATTYATKGIVDKTERVKILFLVDYDTVKKAGTRDGFTNLLRSISEFITNIDRFSSSIAIVISKVPKYINNNILSDKQVIELVAKFIAREVQPVLQNGIMNHGLSDKDKLYYKQALKFISIILEKRGDDYPKIGLFRLPDQGGPFSNISLVQNGKERIEKIIYEKLNFTMTTKDDFDYTIPDESKNDINEIVQEIKRNIISGIGVMGRNIQRFFSIKEKTYDIKQIHNEINSEHEKLSNAQIKANHSTSKECIELIEKNTSNFNNTIVDDSSLSAMKSYTNFFEFLKKNNMIGQSDSFKCFDGLTAVIEYLNDSKKWYKFLLNIYDDLSDYNIQKNITACSNAAMKLSQISDDKETATNSMKIFLENCSQQIYNHEYDHIKNVTLDESKLKALNKILNYTLQHASDQSCDPDATNKLVIKGRYVKFSDIVNTRKNCSKQIEVMEVFALNKVYIDASLNKTGENFKLYIIAPIWDIQGHQNIILDGSPGKFLNLKKALDGYNSGSNGMDGKPGLPGGAAGFFLGVGKVFSNSDELNISANGGEGGPGQHGGNGANGIDGIEPKVPRNTKTSEEYEKLDPEKGTVVEVVSTIYNRKIDDYYEKSEIEIYGQNCTSGGDGGHGGSGGYGGEPGVFFISLVHGVQLPNIRNNSGKLGPDGKGGNGGIAGRTAKMIRVERKKYLRTSQSYTLVAEHGWERIYKLLDSHDLPSCMNGTPGISGNIKPNNESKTNLLFKVSHTLNNYKNYLRENLVSNRPPVNESSLTDFYNLIENNTHAYYDASGFINELYGLEHQFSTLHKKISFVPFYKSLLSRINQYEKELKNGAKLDQVLNYLRGAVLSKIRIINNNLEDYLVINVKKYLQKAKEDILTYKKALKQVTINDHKEEFESMINGQITRANILIKQHILPEIDNIILKTDEAFRSLIEETKNLKETAEENETKLRNYQQKLKDQLISRKMLGYIQVASVFLAFAGPPGAAMGAAIGGVSAAIQTFTLDDTSLPTSVGKQVTKIQELLKNKQQKLKDSIGAAEQALNEFTLKQPSDDLNDLKNKLAQARINLAKEQVNGHSLDPASVDKMYTIRTEITKLLENKTKLLKEQQSTQDRKINDKLNILTHVGTIVNVGEVAADIYGKIKNQEGKIDALDVQIIELHDYVGKLEKYEQGMYNTMVSMIISMQKYSNSTDKSHADLDVNTWKLQSKVKDVQFQIQEMTEGFTVQENVKHCIQQLESAMTTMNRIYDRIQDYKDQSHLASYIAALSSGEAKQITDNSKLSSEIDNLKLMIKSNLVIEEYENGINAFKQFVFPFAGLYLDKLTFSLNAQLENIMIFVDNVADEIQKLYDELEKDDTTIKNKIKNFIFRDAFSGKKNTSFYTWKYNANKEDIIKLLQGNVILLQADVTQSANNAIKFNEIGISFKCANNTIQHQLDKQLTEFAINMTHLGNSYYRYNDKFYLIEHENITIVHSVNNNNGDYSEPNDVYTDIKANEPLLSPYTMWQIKLEHKRGHRTDNDFSALQNYTNQVIIDLELEGRGSYMKTGAPVLSDADIEKYYKIDDRLQLELIKLVPSRISNLRKRAALIDYESEVETTMSSGASSSPKPFGYDIVNWIKTNVSWFKYVTRRIKNYWFNEDDYILGNSLHQDRFNDSLIDGTRLLGIGHNIDHMFINENKNNVSVLNCDLLAQQSNILLLELLLRKKNGMKLSKQNANLSNRYETSEYAHNLAYNAYAFACKREMQKM